MRSALWVPLFDELADPLLVARLAAEAEEAGWHGVLRVGPPGLAAAGARGRRPVDHAGRRRDGDRAAAARPDGHPAPPPAAGQGRPRDRDAGPAQRRPAHARRRPGQRPVRPRVLRDRRASSTTGARGAMLDEALADPRRRLVGRAGAAPRRALRRRRPHVPAPPAQRPDPGVGRRVPRPARPLRRAATRDGFFPVNLEHPDQLAAVATSPRACRPARHRGRPVPRAPTSPRSPPQARPGG